MDAAEAISKTLVVQWQRFPLVRYRWVSSTGIYIHGTKILPEADAHGKKAHCSEDLKLKVGNDSAVRLGWASLWLKKTPKGWEGVRGTSDWTSSTTELHSSEVPTLTRVSLVSSIFQVLHHLGRIYKTRIQHPRVTILSKPQ
ncbi:hypothetical protein C5167_018044 [Papaver somniferum]|uniref:Uncharacterized protein n=1 Tax=Papaver somniferum TaxID=3469 RepID=A0A4Y7IQ66_PAPSO|nr:hypothetical protein C5167_018044 [Papaver somniferum]